MVWKSRNNPDNEMCHHPKYFFLSKLRKLKTPVRKHMLKSCPIPQYKELEHTVAVLRK